MTAPSAEEQLRTQVRAALTRAQISQAEACRRLGLSTKHMNMMLTGRATLTLDWAERILALCGKRLVIETRRQQRSGQ
ncbi:helix-turn-helix transcriptional regulator [Streptomyces longwoodensis]|uniref:helix-turn-helix domain-containing protein n=1 Tax=Streptomyces longwoodensis TaxID=68231 RepID=UPI0033D40FD4